MEVVAGNRSKVGRVTELPCDGVRIMFGGPAPSTSRRELTMPRHSYSGASLHRRPGEDDAAFRMRGGASL